MKVNTIRCYRWIAALVLFLLFMASSQALAANATEVMVENIILDGLTPGQIYWKNDGSGGTANDYNVFFDLSTAMPTLRLKDAEINELSFINSMLATNGDIILEFTGSNLITYAGTDAADILGIYVRGELMIIDATTYGTGSLTIDITHGADNEMTDAVYAESGSITVESGTINVSVYDGSRACGLYADHDININGGKTTVSVTSDAARGLYAYDLFSMSGGAVVASITADEWDSAALAAHNILVTGGSGKFSASGAAVGGFWEIADTGEFRVTGGRIIFTSKIEALLFDTNNTLTPDVSEEILVSTYNSGDGKTAWNSSMGPLAGSYYDYPDYLYVELTGTLIPLTGDAARPWLWLFIGFAALLAGGGAGLLLRKKLQA